MNERILLLAEQADDYAEQTVHYYQGQFDGLTWEGKIKQTRDTKFARLIVRECGLWFNDRLVVNPDYGIEHRVERNRAVIGVMEEFNQHFGVEE